MVIRTVPADPIANIANIFQEVFDRLSELERPTGTQLAQTVQKIFDLFDNLDATVQASISANSYNKTQIDARIAAAIASTPSNVQVNGSLNVSGTSVFQGVATANSGLASSGDVTAQGIIYSNGVLQSPGSRGYVVSTSYVGAWINSDGKIGASPSARRFKKNFELLEIDADAFLSIRTKAFHFKEQRDDEPKRVGVIAEEVAAAGFPEYVPIVTDPEDLHYGEPLTVEYQMLVVPLMDIVRQQQQAIKDLQARVAQLEGTNQGE